MRPATIPHSDNESQKLVPINATRPSPHPIPQHEPVQVAERNHRIDQLVAALMLIPALPVIAIVWTITKLSSSGPGFYSQKRTGLRGTHFHIHKIRTMSWNCESSTGAVWARPDDPRITSFGRFLRATHLDELPQLFNVLAGDMALVGPRPERPEIIERLVTEIPGYLDRLAVHPGLTGLAQVCTGADQTLEDVRLKLEYDRVYLQKQSVWLDARIIACTLLKMLHLNVQWVRKLLLPEGRRIHSHRHTPFGGLSNPPANP